MTKKEILNRALNHQSGPVPFDMGSTCVSGLHCSVVEKLRQYYGLENHPVIISEPYQMLGKVEDDLREAMGIDIDSITEESCIFGFSYGNEKEWRTPWGQIVLVPAGFQTTVDEKKTTYIYPCGDTNCPPSAKMPVSSYFFDSIIRGNDYDEDHPHVEDNLEEYSIISHSACDHIKKQLSRHIDDDRGLVFGLGGCALGDIVMVTAPMLRHPKGLRDIADWYMTTVTNPEYLHAIFEKQTDIALQNLKITYDILGETISVIYLCGADFGTQKAPFCSRETFRSLFLPYYVKMTSWIHEHTHWKILKHSCGSIRPLLRDIIDAGFDIINPVQWSAADMDPQTLKREFGKDLVFWGGGVNTQSTLPFGTPKQVREEALHMLEIFSKDGGYVFASIHNIQAKTPVENIVAFADAVHTFNGK